MGKYTFEIIVLVVVAIGSLAISFIIGGAWGAGAVLRENASKEEAQRNKDIFEMVGVRCYKDTPSCWVCVGDTFKLRHPDTPKEIKDYTIKITELENERFGYINQTTGKASEVDFAVFDGFCRVFVKTGSNTELMNRLLE